MTAAPRRRTIGWFASLAAGSALLGLAPTAGAAPRPGGSDFTCRASAARVTLLGTTLLEPTIANASDAPCANGTAAILNPTDIGPVRVDLANADTVVQPANLAGAPAADGDNGRATASVTNPVVDVGGGATGIRLTADVIGATASYTCRAGAPVPAGSSVVANIVLTVGGVATPITLPGNNQPYRLDLPAGLGTLLLNQTVQTNGRIVQRALQLQVPVDGSVADVVIGEAAAGFTGNPCAAAVIAPPANPQCSDGADNDGDGLADAKDPGCLSGPGGTYNPRDDDETDPNTPGGTPQCSDGLDNDGDLVSDARDPGCLSGPNGAFNPADDDERDQGNLPQCSDGIDNDKDGRTDFPRDTGCSSANDRTEATPRGQAKLTSSPSGIATGGVSGTCTKRSFTARVSGRSIRSVVFSVDGRRVRTDRTSPYTARISTTRRGAHRVSARVTFASDSRTAARSLSFRFRRCAAGAPKVRFTG
ncbi:Ig-like domain-containing protein [Patulibacter minatonensis]|uniref:Ig-like domain-containing protein n=1 Tax=Patulibacter minatonensis TaxID=298163 RepID=UPI000478E159|nr:Ig-like domain-containing protein [Patulibacter minatonensis]